MGVLTSGARETVISGRATPEVSPMLFDCTLPLRFWSKVYAHENGCWVWRGSIDSGGYGRVWGGGSRKDGTGRLVPAHRWSYEALVGIVPLGLQSDHLCRNRACVNPAHIEPVTNRENVLRGNTYASGAINRSKTHCPQDHPYNEANTYY